MSFTAGESIWGRRRNPYAFFKGAVNHQGTGWENAGVKFWSRHSTAMVYKTPPK